MSKKVVAYLAGVPNPHKSPHKTEILKSFVQGVSATGDNGIAHAGKNIIDSDCALIQGWVHAGSPNTPHLQLRRRAFETNTKKGKHTIIIDSNLFNYEVGKTHPMHYSRYSMDGVFPTTGNYFTDTIDPKRWTQIRKDLGIKVKEWRPNGVHILICTQRNGGWSMSGVPVVEWLDRTIKELRKHTDRPIVVRGHPGDKNAKKYLTQKKYNVSFKPKITQDLKNAWATITYNSSPGVASAIEGIPVFVTDPIPQISQAYPVANTDLSLIETPSMFDRDEWLQGLAMSHWKVQEIKDGTAWTHMRNYI